MGKDTKISWCDASFNPWIGCTKVHEGCKFCYAEELMDNRYHTVEWGATGTRKKTKTWKEPVKWNKEAEKLGVKYKVFCASLADIFEDRNDLTPWRKELFKLIDDTPNLNWQILTKRPENIRKMWEGGYRNNIWRGTSPCNQTTFDTSVIPLIQTNDLSPIAFLSFEPLIGPVTITECLINHIHWAIIGGESGDKARECKLEWIEDLKNQCIVAGIPVFVKQLGSNPTKQGNLYKTSDRKGDIQEEFPISLIIRQFPGEQ